MSLDTLEDLLIDNLRDLHNAENQQVKSLQKLAKAASRPELKRAIEEHLGQTRGQIERLEQIFSGMGKSPRGKKCAGMEGLVEEGAEVLEESEDDAVKDAGIIVALQKAEHYEIAAYGSVRTFADQLGMKKAAQLLDRSLAEEKKADEKLNKIAMKGGVNVQAQQGDTAGNGRASANSRAGTARSRSAVAGKSRSSGSKSAAGRSTAAKSSSAKSSAKSRNAKAGTSRSSKATPSPRASQSRSATGATKSAPRVSSGKRTAARPTSNAKAKSPTTGPTASATAISDVTRDHDLIRRWVEQRGGKPACVKGVGNPGDVGLLRIDFPGYTGEETLQEISWDEFFDKFDEENLAFLYQEKTADGKQSRFSKLISRESLGR